VENIPKAKSFEMKFLKNEKVVLQIITHCYTNKIACFLLAL